MIILYSLFLLLTITRSITQYDMGDKSYQQCADVCASNANGRLAYEHEILDYLNERGGQLGGDIWTPIGESYNAWLQIGGGGWPYGELHTEIHGGTLGKPGWGTQVGTQVFKKKFYCGVVPTITEYDINTKTYQQCADLCTTNHANGGRLAYEQEILHYLGGKLGGDIWTPVADSDNAWLQIGGGGWPYGELHTEIYWGTLGKPVWGTQVGTQVFKKKMYCVGTRAPQITEYSAVSRSYSECRDACEDENNYLATKAEIINYLDGSEYGDKWAPVSDSYNDWVQVGRGGLGGGEGRKSRNYSPCEFGELWSDCNNKYESNVPDLGNSYKHAFYCSDTYLNKLCPPLNTDGSTYNRCGPKYGGVRCNKNLPYASLMPYCSIFWGACESDIIDPRMPLDTAYDFEPDTDVFLLCEYADVNLVDSPRNNSYYLQISQSTLMVIGGLVSAILVVFFIIILLWQTICRSKRQKYYRVKNVDSETEFA